MRTCAAPVITIRPRRCCSNHNLLQKGIDMLNQPTIEKLALRKKLAGSVIHAAFSKATNSVLVAASRWAFNRRYLRFL